jgi:hypothetical protein
LAWIDCRETPNQSLHPDCGRITVIQGSTSHQRPPRVLLHKYNQCNSFGISVHGPPEFCRAVAAGVGVEAEPSAAD